LEYVEKHDYPSGDFYSGYMLEGKPHGHGTGMYVDGSKYKGGWKLGEKNGKGKMWYADG
jgi:hypothetical protein